MKLALILLTVTCALAAPVDDPVQEFIDGNHVFSAAVYKELVKGSSGNLIVSPFSVETVLALTYEGAQGVTATELVAGLSLPDTKQKVEQAYQSFLPKLRATSDEDLKVGIANKIYVEEGVLLEDSFKSVALNVYGSGVENVDFEDSVDTAAEINEWVEEQTNHKIKNLVSPDSLDDSTAIVLVNALYLSGKWAVPFSSYPVRKNEFFTTKDTSVVTDMLHNEAVYSYYENKELDAKFVELKLKGGDVSLVVALPNQIDGLAGLEEKIDQVLEPQPFGSMKVVLDLPKFTIESTSSFVPVLKSLGIQRLFSPVGAELTGFSSNVKNLFVSDVIQKAYISITEGGLEAAAATEVIIGITAVLGGEKVNFKADHPFLYYIKEDDVILFSGRYVNPSQ